MARKQETIFVPYKEIVCLAIKEISREIDEYEEKAKGKGTDAANLVTSVTKPLYEKREILKSLYRAETGTEYN